ncbi:MAG TPA: TlpA disulfide reductase family protein [Actinomycetota bacterium]
MSDDRVPLPGPPLEPAPSGPRMSVPVAASAFVLALAVLVLVQVAIRDGEDGSTQGGARTDAPVALNVEGPARSQLLAAGERVPAFTAPELFGGRVSWEDYAGSPTVLAVWAPWCPHCQAELPVVVGVMSEFPSVRLVSVVTAVDAQVGPTPTRYMRSQGLDFPVAVDDAAGTLARAFGIRAFPTMFFVGSDGTVRYVYEGEMAPSDLRSVLASL